MDVSSIRLRREVSERRAEQRVTKRRLRERSNAEQRREPRFTARGMHTVDDVAERKQGKVLEQRELQREAARVRRRPAQHLLVRETEEGAVRHVHRKTG